MDSIKNEKLRAKIADAREQIVQNREMVRLDTDLPVPVPLDELVIAPRYDELIAALEWCEFRSMLAEVRAEAKRVRASAGKDGDATGETGGGAGRFVPVLSAGTVSVNFVG